MYERNRSGIRAVEENPESVVGGLIALSVALALVIKGFSEQNLAMIGAGALVYGGYEGARWFLNRRREREIAEPIESPIPINP